MKVDIKKHFKLLNQLQRNKILYLTQYFFTSDLVVFSSMWIFMMDLILVLNKKCSSSSTLYTLDLNPALGGKQSEQGVVIS